MVSEGSVETLNVGSALRDFSWVPREQHEASSDFEGPTVEGMFLLFHDHFLFAGRTRNWIQRSCWSGWATWI